MTAFRKFWFLIFAYPRFSNWLIRKLFFHEWRDIKMVIAAIIAVGFKYFQSKKSAAV